MIKLSKDRVLLLHELMTRETGGGAGVRDFGLLDSALENAFQTFDGRDLYPTKREKAARLGYNLVSNHAFVDGNKRIGMYVMITFLEVNGISVTASSDEITRAGLALADGSMDYGGLLKWINDKS